MLMFYFNAISFFSSSQFGFLPHKGTDLAVREHVGTITENVDKHKYTVALYLDFQKAFDVLDIDILICKFKKASIGGAALKWLSSFCRERKQVVKINNVLSDVLELQYGTAQGGVLGPLLFLVYINDLLNLNFYSFIFAYADDTTIVCSSCNRDSLKVQLGRDLEKISQWLIKNKLLINSSKLKCIMFFLL